MHLIKTCLSQWGCCSQWTHADWCQQKLLLVFCNLAVLRSPKPCVSISPLWNLNVWILPVAESNTMLVWKLGQEDFSAWLLDVLLAYISVLSSLCPP